MLAARHRARLTMEERNTPDESRIRNVRRRLFQHSLDNDDGEDDNIVNRLLEEDHKQRELRKQRWNFDFEKEEPLPGRYEWVKIDDHGNAIPNSAMLNNKVDAQDKPQEKQTEEMENNASDTNRTESNK